MTMTAQDWKEVAAVIREVVDEHDLTSGSDDMVERVVEEGVATALRQLADAFDFKADCTPTDEDRS